MSDTSVFKEDKYNSKTVPNLPILTVIDCTFDNLQSLLKIYQLKLELIEPNKQILGSFWGDSEAGLITNTLYVREDTPIHSLLHETCHYICMDDKRRLNLDTDAKGSDIEESSVCYLQILLANFIPEMTTKRMIQDMDKWGYSFRLGSAKAWFENDAEDALNWLQEYGLVDTNKTPSFKLRI